jgi:hypothetical protein
VNNVPDDYDGDANFGVGDCCESCGDPLSGHNCSYCGEPLDCADTGNPDTQICVECSDREKEIEEALDNDLGANT